MVDLHSSRACPNNHNSNAKTVLIITLRLHLISFYSIAFMAKESARNKVLIAKQMKISECSMFRLGAYTKISSVVRIIMRLKLINKNEISCFPSCCPKPEPWAFSFVTEKFLTSRVQSRYADAVCLE